MNNYQAVIGLEIHVEMKTHSKMFSSAPVSHNSEPNTCANEIDFAFPGAMPTINKQAVINAIRVAHALNMEIDKVVAFDRKNYFYSDLPKGYQLTQYYRPLGKNGYVEILDSENEEIRVGISRLHIEEDTCKQIHLDKKTLIDFNRAGIPLLEIVSLPELKNGVEAVRFIEEIRSIVSFLDVSDGRMENGSLRCDVNISLKSTDSMILGHKVEIKNLNSLTNVQKAIDFEIIRQKKIIDNGEEIKKETRRYDENSKMTVSMRDKNDRTDYKYFLDPNIPPITLSDDFIENAIKTANELAKQKIQKYKMLGLNEYDCNLLVSSKEISNYFDKALSSGANPKLLANWINVEVRSILNERGIFIENFSISPVNLGKLIVLIENKVISSKQGKELFRLMLNSDEDPNDLIKRLDLSQIDNEQELLKIVIKILDNHPQLIIEYRNGKDKVIKYFVGEVMKETKGKANPLITQKLILEEIDRRK